MKTRPILFSGPMVRALLDGRKTQTRRVIKGVPSRDHYGRDIMDWGLSGIHQETYDPNDPIEGTDRWHLDVQTDVDDHSRRVIRCPYGAPGDFLWVRECFSFNLYQEGCWYWADGNIAKHDCTRPKPSIHMPRWASRLTLEVTEVRVERLQHISRADAIAEGLILASAQIEEFWRWPEPHHEHLWLSPPEAYRHLWEQINGDGSWAANPWVWALTFSVHHQNIDAVLRDPEDKLQRRA